MTQETSGTPAKNGAIAPFDAERAERAVRELLIAVGEDPDRDGLKETPARVARAYVEMFGGLHVNPDDVLATTFDVGHDELVLVKDIPMYSTCEHHLVSFHGVAHVGYIPGPTGQVTGLSKLARLVDLYAKRPQVQERLTTQIADAIVRKLDPRGGHRGDRSRAPVHGDAWNPQAGRHHHHLCGSRSVQDQRGLAGRSPRPHLSLTCDHTRSIVRGRHHRKPRRPDVVDVVMGWTA